MMEAMERSLKIKSLCVTLLENRDDDHKKSISHLEELLNLVKVPFADCQIGIMHEKSYKISSLLIVAIFKLLERREKERAKWSECERILITQIIVSLYSNVKLDDIKLYFKITGYLLEEIDPSNRAKSTKISEDYMMSLLECVQTLTNSISLDALLEMYDKANAAKLSLVLFHVVRVLEVEKYRKLIILGIETIMCLARVSKEEDLYDYELCNKVADVFIFYLPKIAVVLKNVATSDEKVGHRVISIAIRAWGHIVMIMTRDYRSVDDKLNTSIVDDIEETRETFKDIKFNNVEDMNRYIESRRRTREWYRHTDEKIHKLAEYFVPLTNYNHNVIRRELIDMCNLFVNNCNNTLPKTVSVLIQIVIILTEDEDDLVKKKSNKILNDLTVKMNNNVIRTILETSEENFYQCVLRLPRIFNSFDESMQCRSLHLLLGYLRLFGKRKLVHMLHSPVHLSGLLASLLQISELDKSKITSLEEYNSADLQLDVNVHLNNWRNFRYFRNEFVLKKIIAICGVLSQMDAIDIVTDFLIETYCNESDQKKEATFLLNEIVSFQLVEDTPEEERSNRLELIKNVINLYLEPANWNLTLDTNDNDSDIRRATLSEVQENILQICLQLDGIGKMALICEREFNDLLLKTLYPILEKIGCGNVPLKESGLDAIANITRACGFKDVTELINKNSDYFSFSIAKRLRSIERNRDVLNVFSVVMKYSTIDVLPYISNIAEELLMDSCDLLYSKDPNSFLRFFQIFINCLTKWLNILPLEVPVKSRLDKQREIREFQLSGIEEFRNFSDDTVMNGKTAEEMYVEDMSKEKKDIEEELYPDVEEYKKPEPPAHIKTTVSILKKSLNYLPAKQKSTKLLSLDIIRRGVEVIRNYEDELLPVVHLVWSPLIERFKEIDEPLIVNLSFQLLQTLAKLSKDFIRSRTSIDVLPTLLDQLTRLSKESYLKDKGAVYRYTQSYKLQEMVSKNIGDVLCYLDSQEEDFMKSSEAVVSYLSNKQPQPLQDGAIRFYRTVMKYDENLFEKLLNNADDKLGDNKEYENNLTKIKTLSED